MTPTRIRTILAVAIGAAAVSLVGLDLASGLLSSYLVVPWSVTALMLAMAAAILAAAWPVRQYVKGRRRRIDPLRAASVVALAKACALAGAALTGLYLAMAVLSLAERHSLTALAQPWQEIAAVGAAIVLTIAGRVGEWFCRLPPEPGEPSEAREPGEAGAEPAPG
jgi:hypothetical protein